MKRLVMGFVFTGAALAQSLSFEAASIKSAPPPDGHGMRVGNSGGPGTKDPGLFTCENCTVASLVANAWNIKFYQLSGLDPVSGERFMISARVPVGATKEQFRLMMQNLLFERFKLAIHHDRKEMQMYDLVVAKNGPKLKESTPAPVSDDPPAARSGSSKTQFDKDGFPILKGTGMSMMIVKDRARTNWTDFTIEQLATNLSYQVGKPVTDATGLKGKYDIALSWVAGSGPSAAPQVDAGGFSTAAASDSLPDLFTALQEQLGLKLEPKKGMVDIIAVDHAEKLPTEN